MKIENSILKKSIFSLIFIGIAFLSIIFIRPAPMYFSPPSAPEQPPAISKDTMIAYTNKFPIYIGARMFAHTYTISGQDIYNYINTIGCQTIALYNGLVVANNYNNTNKLLFVAPVDANYRVIQNKSCLSYRFTSNICSTGCNFGVETLRVSPSVNLPLVNPAQSKININNYTNYAGRDPIKGILLQRSSLDLILKDGTGNIINDLRVHHAISSAGRRMVVLSGVTPTTGIENPNAPIQIINSTSLCPNNCDYY